MGIFDIFKNKAKQEENTFATEKGYIYMPMEGEVIPLEEINDGVFSAEILGKGCGVKPLEGKVYAPFDAEVVQVADTKHAIGLLSNDGIELLIHVGMDTVAMNGAGFEPLVKTGDKVKCGQLMMNFSMDEIKKAGYVTTTALVITNTDNFKSIETIKLGQMAKLDKVLHVK